MTWVKLDDGFFLHPKALAAGRDGRDLYLAGLCWSAGQETDGLIPAHALALIAMVAGVADADQAASRLVEVGLWITDPDGWRIRGYGDWQTTRADRDAWRAKERARKQTSRRTTKDNQTSASVREVSARTTRGIRAIDVDVDVDIDLSSTAATYPHPTPPAAEDETTERKANEALHLIADTLATRNNARSPAYAATIIKQAHQLPALRTLARSHPTDTITQLAHRYLDTSDPTNPPTRCTTCHAISHTTQNCPTQ